MEKMFYRCFLGNNRDWVKFFCDMGEKKCDIEEKKKRQPAMWFNG